jgi:hypothetical protein
VFPAPTITTLSASAAAILFAAVSATKNLGGPKNTKGTSIPVGPLEGVGSADSRTVPSGLMRPTRPAALSVNHAPPETSRVIPQGSLVGSISEYSTIVPS